MTWDLTVPEDDDLISAGPGDIRAMKEDLETALTTEGSFPGADPVNPKFRYTPPRGNTASRPSSGLATGQLYINTQTGALERYNGATWDEVNTLPAASGILTTHIGDAQVTADKLAAAVAGSGLAGGAGTALSVSVDEVGLTIVVDTLRLKDGGVAEDKLNASVAGSGLTGGAGSPLAVNVDNSTVEVNSDAVRVKDAGVTEAKLAAAVVTKLGQNIGMVAIASNSGSAASFVNYSGQGRLKGITNSGGITRAITVVVDGVTVFNTNLVNGQAVTWGQSGLASAVGDLASLDIHFRASLVVTTGDTSASSINVAYERAA